MTAAGWITLIVAGISGVLYAVLTLLLIVAKDDVLREFDKQLAEQGGATSDSTPRAPTEWWSGCSWS